MYALTQDGKEVNERMIAVGKTRWVAGCLPKCSRCVDAPMHGCVTARDDALMRTSVPENP